jgi:AcrR family transcriptional regulator
MEVNEMESNSIKMQQIIDTARRLFTDYGYKKVSMDEIAMEAEVAKVTIYQYFKDKDDLLKYFINDEISKMKILVEKIETESKTPFDMIHRTIYELLMYRRTQKIIITISKEAESLHSGSVFESIKMIDKSIMEYIEMRLKIGIEKKAVRPCDTKVMAFVLFKVYVALAFQWEENNEQLNEKEISDNLSLFLKTGLLT